VLFEVDGQLLVSGCPDLARTKHLTDDYRMARTSTHGERPDDARVSAGAIATIR
jgi:hypothetical protein